MRPTSCGPSTRSWRPAHRGPCPVLPPQSLPDEPAGPPPAERAARPCGHPPPGLICAHRHREVRGCSSVVEPLHAPCGHGTLEREDGSQAWTGRARRGGRRSTQEVRDAVTQDGASSRSDRPADIAGDAAPTDLARVEVTVHGQVQGVGYRAFARSRALALGLRGWARNEPDGTVTVLAEGERAALDAFIEALRQGPPAAQVQGLEVRWGAARGLSAGFGIR
ncbi:acylphosphatase [Thermaerobacter sp. FW80]|nr:acylphosphatase [Thermaerobacter sp. FW80]